MNSAGFSVSCTVLLLLGSVSIAQTGLPAAGRGNQPTSQVAFDAMAQHPLASALHMRALNAGGKLKEVREQNTQDLAANLPSLMAKSEQIVLGHVLRRQAIVTQNGDSVSTEYDVLVLLSLKGNQNLGSIIRIVVPAGSYRFTDGVQAESQVKGFSGLLDGGRYAFFLHAVEKGSNLPPNAFRLAGDGVQGALLLDDRTVRPALNSGNIWNQIQPQTVQELLAQLEAVQQTR